ncbi:MAG: hydroxyphenylacetyl-CoA thioesterase PaaI [Myxococcota bacterium]
MSDGDAKARRIAEAMLSQEGTGPHWGIEIEEAGEGWCRLSMVIQPTMLNGHRIAHGGMIFALADTAFAYACNGRDVATVAQGASITFLSPGQPGERLSAVAREVALQGRSGVYAVVVTGEDGRTVAVFQGTSRAFGGSVLGAAERNDTG